MTVTPSVSPPHASSFEDLLLELSVSFLNAPPGGVDAQIEAALRHIVGFIGVDRGTVIGFTDEPGQLVATHSAALAGVDPVPTPVPEKEFVHSASCLRSGRSIIVSRIADLGPEWATDLPLFRRIGQKSMAIFPLFASGHFLGAVSFGTIRREVEWPPEVVRRLRLAAEMFASVLLKRNREDELRAALAETRELKERFEEKNLVLRDELGSNADFEEIVGESPPLRRVLDQASLVAGTDSTLLLLGETGSGKCVVARTVHRRSRRSESPLIHVNCAALPATLIESELFGHEKGAFSGALQRRFGRFELADGGTIFLDEIGELSDEIQAKLLRVLESGEFERVGSSATQRVDVRIIAATNRDLPHAVAEGRFRDDLYYRLGVFPIEVPPLRERREDIPLLATYFLEKQRGRLNKSIDHVPARTMEQLKAYAWPGNVRELENVIERAMIMSPGSALVLDGVLGGGLVPGAPPSIPATEETPPTRTLEEVERDYIRQACERCGWRIGGKGSASEFLGLNPSTLRSRMKKLGVSRPQGGIGFGT